MMIPSRKSVIPAPPWFRGSYTSILFIQIQSFTYHIVRKLKAIVLQSKDESVGGEAILHHGVGKANLHMHTNILIHHYYIF